jgi:hypothetical protein
MNKEMCIGREREGSIFRKIQGVHKANDMFLWLATLPIVLSPKISEGHMVSVFAVERLTKEKRGHKIAQETRRFGRNFSAFIFMVDEQNKK